MIPSVFRMFSTKVLPPIKITDAAWRKMANISENSTFLLSAISGGCNGFQYKFQLINKNHFSDLRIKPLILQNKNVTVTIDPKSEFLLIGTTIDFIHEDYKNGIFENKFVFVPNQNNSSCGCGISFTPKS